MSDKFKKDFYKLLEKLKSGENFAFVRYSDGETAVMQNKKLVLASDHVQVGEQTLGFGYSEDDHKEFLPERDGFLKDALIESFVYEGDNYFVGAGCSSCTCTIAPDIPWLLEKRKKDKHWTTPNLFVNSNYPLFIEHFVPEFSKHKIVMICSEKADLEELPFEVVKDFRVGKNCIINDHHLVEDMVDSVKEQNVRDHVFLFSASSLSEILIHKLFSQFNNNTYIDIGTTLHPYMDLSIKRDYLKAHWLGQPLSDLNRSCY